MTPEKVREKHALDFAIWQALSEGKRVCDFGDFSFDPDFARERIAALAEMDDAEERSWLEGRLIGGLRSGGILEVAKAGLRLGVLESGAADAILQTRYANQVANAAIEKDYRRACGRYARAQQFQLLHDTAEEAIKFGCQPDPFTKMIERSSRRLARAQASETSES